MSMLPEPDISEMPPSMLVPNLVFYGVLFTAFGTMDLFLAQKGLIMELINQVIKTGPDYRISALFLAVLTSFTVCSGGACAVFGYWLWRKRKTV